MRSLRTLVFLSALLGAAAAALACSDDGPIAPDASQYPGIIALFGLEPLPTSLYPTYNQYQEDRIKLGRLLFFDPILGGESAPWLKMAAGRAPYRDRRNDVACGTCHHPNFGFADGNRLGVGVGGGTRDEHPVGPDRVADGVSLLTGQPVGLEPRNSPTVLNTAFNGRGSSEPNPLSFQFMDGRVTLGLEQQAQEPITDREEMAGDAYGRDLLGDDLSTEAIQDSVTARLRDIPDYVDMFVAAFPGEILSAADIQLVHVTQALAAYERELITPGSRYDRFISGEVNALSIREQTGFVLFFGKAECGGCHFGPMLSDFSFHVQGAADDYDAVRPGFPGKNGEGGDFGRFHADPVQFVGEKYAFRTPTLRNAELTAPYFHSGSEATLLEVVDFYNRGGQGEGALDEALLEAVGAVLDPLIRPLGLTQTEMSAIVAFMQTTTASVPPGPGGMDLTEVPQRVPSGLLPPGIPTPVGPGPFFPEE